MERVPAVQRVEAVQAVCSQVEVRGSDGGLGLLCSSSNENPDTSDDTIDDEDHKVGNREAKGPGADCANDYDEHDCGVVAVHVWVEASGKGVEGRRFCAERKRREVRDKRKRSSTNISAFHSQPLWLVLAPTLLTSFGRCDILSVKKRALNP